MTEHPWQTIYGQPPSKSNSYRIVRINGVSAIRKTDAVEQYEQNFYIQLGQYKNLNITGFFELHIRCYFRSLSSDLDGAFKVILDTLQTAHAIKNDNRCTRIVADKFVDKLNPRIEFRLVEV